MGAAWCTHGCDCLFRVRVSSSGQQRSAEDSMRHALLPVSSLLAMYVSGSPAWRVREKKWIVFPFSPHRLVEYVARTEHD